MDGADVTVLVEVIPGGWGGLGEYIRGSSICMYVIFSMYHCMYLYVCICMYVHAGLEVAVFKGSYSVNRTQSQVEALPTLFF